MNETRDQIETALVGALLFEPEKATALFVDAGMRPDWFLDDGLAAIYTVASDRFRDGTIAALDALAITEEARRLVVSEKWKRGDGVLANPGFDVVQRIIDAATALGQVEWYIGRLRGMVYETSFKKAFAAAVKTFIVDPVGCITQFMDRLAEMARELTGDTTVSKRQVCDQIESAEYESWHMRVDPEGPKDLEWVPGLKAPWRQLTRLYLGIGKRLHIIAARPSVGKTSIAVNFIRAWADQGVKVLVNSLDMPPEDVIDRMRTEYSRISISKKRYTPTEKNLAKLKEASEWLCSSPISVCESYYVEDFCVDLTLKAKTGKIDVVVVDYVQLLNSYKVDNANEYERVSYVVEYLKRTANRLKIPIFALCQLNRKSAKDADAEPTLTDLRGSGAIEQAASSVILLYRDQDVIEYWKSNPPYWLYDNEEYGRKCAAQSLDAVWVILAKNQNGPTGRLPFIVNKPYFCWKLADEMMEPKESTEGHGATQRSVKQWYLSFMRFHRDWRSDSWEKSLEGKTVPLAVPGIGLTAPVLIDN